MGNCGCYARASPQRYEGVEIPISGLGPSYSKSKTLTDDDVKGIMRQIIYSSHNTKLYDKVELASKRSKELKNGITDNYVNLVKQTKDLENNCFKISEERVLEGLRVDPKDFKNAKGPINMKNLLEILILELLRDIKKNKSKLNIDEEKINEIREQSEEAYHSSNFKLRAVPETSKKLSDIYDDDLPITYEDVMVADHLYSKYGLLPIELQAFLVGEH